MSRCSRSFLSMIWGWSHLLQFLVGNGPWYPQWLSSAGTLRFCLPCGKMALPQVGRLKLIAWFLWTKWPLGVVTKKIQKAEPMKSNDLSKVMAAQRMLKWDSRWVQHLSSGVTWFLPCFTCRCVLICDQKICLQMAMTPCHQCPKTHLQSSSTGWLIGDFYSTYYEDLQKNLKSQNMFGLSILLV